MAINRIEAVLQNSSHTGSDLLLMIVLADAADRDKGTCYPGRATLARLMRMSERNVQRCIKTVVDSGEVSVATQGSHLGTNLYRLNPALLQGGDKMSGGDKLGSQGETPASHKPSVEPSDKKKPRARASQLPQDWTPSPEEVKYAKDRGFSHADVTEMSEDFRLFYHSHRRAMPDWHLTFLRWVREEQKRRQSRFSSRQPVTPPRPVYGNTEAY